MSEWDNMRKHELECMRLASDCMQLAGDVDRPALRSHFIRMARVWTTLAQLYQLAHSNGDFQGCRPENASRINGGRS